SRKRSFLATRWQARRRCPDVATDRGHLRRPGGAARRGHASFATRLLLTLGGGSTGRGAAEGQGNCGGAAARGGYSCPHLTRGGILVRSTIRRGTVGVMSDTFGDHMSAGSGKRPAPTIEGTATEVTVDPPPDEMASPAI